VKNFCFLSSSIVKGKDLTNNFREIIKHEKIPINKFISHNLVLYLTQTSRVVSTESLSLYVSNINRLAACMVDNDHHRNVLPGCLSASSPVNKTRSVPSEPMLSGTSFENEG
jgi:hypothetical protein